MLMNKKPEISVIIPVYNVENYLEKCLQSILEQSFNDYEIIIINDGSTDNTGQILNIWETEHKNICVKNCQNGGVSKARNIGINISDGKFLVFVDGDDYLATDYLLTLWNCVKKDDAELGMVDYYLSYPDHIEPHSITNMKEIKYSSQETIWKLRDNSLFEGYLWNKIFVREIIVNNNIMFDDNIKVWEDMIFCYRYLKKIKNVSYICKPLYYYVQHGTSTMHKNENPFSHYEAVKMLFEMISVADGEFYRSIADELGACLMGMIGNTITGEEIINALKQVELSGSKLSLKHKAKYLFYKIINRKKL